MQSALPALRWAIPLAVVPVLVLLAYGFRTDPREIPSPLVGRPAAPFTLTTFDGNPVEPRGLRGKVVMRQLLGLVVRARLLRGGAEPRARLARPTRTRASWWSASTSRTRTSRRAASSPSSAIRFPNAPDPAGRISVDYGVYGVPETFFIDRKGRVRFKQVGALTDEIMKPPATRDTLLKEPA